MEGKDGGEIVEVPYVESYDDEHDIKEGEISNAKLNDIYLAYVQSTLTLADTVNWLKDVVRVAPCSVG